jgi:hypothetical protein
MRPTMPPLLIALVLAVLQACCAPTTTSDETAVYAVLVNRSFVSDPTTGRQYSQVVIEELTLGRAGTADLQSATERCDPRPNSATINDFRSRNGTYFGGFTPSGISSGLDGRRPLAPGLHFAVPHLLVSRRSVDEVLRNGGWEEFHRLYPDCSGLLCLSRVGFDPVVQPPPLLQARGQKSYSRTKARKRGLKRTICPSYSATAVERLSRRHSRATPVMKRKAWMRLRTKVSNEWLCVNLM